MHNRLQTYTARAAQLTRDERAEMSSITAGFGMIAIVTGLSGLAVLVGLSLPMPTPAASYDVVEISEYGESDIVDYGLTLDDCARVLPHLRAMGHNVECESTPN